MLGKILSFGKNPYSTIQDKKTVYRPDFVSNKAMESEVMLAYKLDRALHYSRMIPELLNKEGFAKVVEEKLTNYEGAYALIYFDAQKFKSINDLYGHANGDIVLKAIGKAIYEASRVGQYHIHDEKKIINNDALSHQSGDEFSALIMPMGEKGKFLTKSAAEYSAQIYISRVKAELAKGVKVSLDSGKKVRLKVGLNIGLFVGDTREGLDANTVNHSQYAIDQADSIMNGSKDPNRRNMEVEVFEE